MTKYCAIHRAFLPGAAQHWVQQRSRSLLTSGVCCSDGSNEEALETLAESELANLNLDSRDGYLAEVRKEQT